MVGCSTRGRTALRPRSQSGFIPDIGLRQRYSRTLVSPCLVPTISITLGTAFDVLDQRPLLGDTTSNQAILFSHTFLSVPAEKPSYPNYTLAPANLSAPDIPSSIPNFTLVIAPTSAQLSSLPQTACALLNTSSSTGSIYSDEPWLRSSEGWRSQWLIDGLSPSTNYTAYVIQDALQVSGPIYFTTKSGKFLLSSHLIPSCSRRPISKLSLSTRLLPPLLPLHRIRRPTPSPPSPRIRLRRDLPPRHHLLAPPPIHVQFHHHALHVCMRTRHLLSPPNLRRLPNQLPRLALHRLVPPLLRTRVRGHHDPHERRPGPALGTPTTTERFPLAQPLLPKREL